MQITQNVMDALRKVKDILYNEASVFETRFSQEIPVGPEGEPMSEYVNYVKLAALHNLLETVTRELATVQTEWNRRDHPDVVKVNVDAKFGMIPIAALDELREILEVSFPGEEHEEDPDDLSL